MDGMAVLSALTDWALEGSVVTGDSMRARGYGTAKRTSFQIYRMTAKDVGLLIAMAVLILAVIATAALGGTKATFTPVWEIVPLTGAHLTGFFAYCAFLLIPTVLHTKEAIQWHISLSKI